MNLASMDCRKRLFLRVFNAMFKIDLQDFIDVSTILHLLVYVNEN